MADTYEQNLSQKGTLTVSDYIRVVGSDNASYKQLVSDVAKKIIENYTGSSLAGSSQSVKSALDALNSKTTLEGVTPAEVASGITDNLFIRKQSGIVTINGYLSSTTAFSNSQTQIMILPQGARPIAQVRIPCALAGAAYNPPAQMGYLLIDSTGYMGIVAPASNTNKVAYFSVSYMAQL